MKQVTEQPRRARHAYEEETNSTKKEIISWVIYILIAIALALVLRFFVFEFVRVDGPSMNPTLESEETVFVEKVSKLTGNYVRGQIVVVHYPDRTESFVKRIIGIEGDTVEILDGAVYLNGQVINEPYIKEPYTEGNMEQIVVPEDHVFVMGDNRNNSQDSRSSSVGPIPESEVLGHAVFVMWPLDHIKGLTQYEIG